MSTFAQLTGFNAGVLRAWERRYDLLEPQRLDGGHRVYTEQDRRVMARVRELLDQGRSIGEVALMGRPKLLADAPPERSESIGPSLAVVPQAGNDDALDAVRARIIKAAIVYDDARVEAALDDAFTLVSPKSVLERVVLPVAHEIGDLWASGDLTVAAEHMVSVALSHRLHKLFEASRVRSRGAPPVICACVPGEQHEMGLQIFALRISAMGLPVCYFGRDLPFEEIDGIIARLSPRAVCLSVSRKPLLDTHLPALRAMAKRHKQVRFHIGGRGVAASEAKHDKLGLRLWPNDTAGLALRQLAM